MKKLQKFVLAAALAATLTIGAFSAADALSRRSSDDALLTRSHQPATFSLVMTRKVNEYEGQHRRIIASSISRKVNEYEGQHR